MSSGLRTPRCERCGDIAKATKKFGAFADGHAAVCSSCHVIGYYALQTRGTWVWADLATWHVRCDVQRIFRVLAAARQVTSHASRSEAREYVNAQFAVWLRRNPVGPWFSMTKADCHTIIERSGPHVAQYSDQLVTGAPRSTLHLIAADHSRFPRVTYLARMVRDRVRTKVRPLGDKVLRWFGVS